MRWEYRACHKSDDDRGKWKFHVLLLLAVLAFVLLEVFWFLLFSASALMGVWSTLPKGVSGPATHLPPQVDNNFGKPICWLKVAIDFYSVCPTQTHQLCIFVGEIKQISCINILLARTELSLPFTVKPFRHFKHTFRGASSSRDKMPGAR